MSARLKKWIELFKSVLIVLLMLSMTILFLLTWSTDSASLPAGVRRVVDGVSHFFGGSSEIAPVVEGSRAEVYGDAAFPVKLAVSSPDGLRAVYAPSGDLDDAYSRLRPVIADCLGSADNANAIGDNTYRAALGKGGVFVDYSAPLPCSLLALSHGVEWGGSDRAYAKTLFLSTDGERIVLYISTGSVTRRFTTDIASSRLESVLTVEGRPAAWSSDFGLDGCVTVYPTGDLWLPTAAAYDVTVAEGSLQSILEAFSMNPETRYRYTSADGTQFAVEDARVLALSAAGVISYTDPNGENAINSRAVLSDDALVEHCRRLVADATQGLTGDAKISFRSLDSTADGSITISFGYTLGELPVYVDGDADCAVFVLKNGSIREARISLRRYAFDGGSTLMMPPSSAAAIGAKALCYYDERTDGVSAAWSR